MVMTDPRTDRIENELSVSSTAERRQAALLAAAGWWRLEGRLEQALRELEPDEPERRTAS